MISPGSVGASKERRPWTIVRGGTAIVAVALHQGHDLRPEMRSLIGLDDADRRREEDPYTDRLAEVAETKVVVHRSRFEVDLNRPVEDSVCLKPEDCWGLDLWRRTPGPEVVDRSRDLHREFYSSMRDLLDETKQLHRRFVVLDIHSYNHRRGGPSAEPDDPSANPDVNVGTGSLDRDAWGELVDRFIVDLASHPAGLDVGENVKFRGRHLAAWIHERFPDQGCCLALEFKKTFLDEWTGRLSEQRLNLMVEALASTLPGLEKALASSS